MLTRRRTARLTKFRNAESGTSSTAIIAAGFGGGEKRRVLATQHGSDCPKNPGPCKVHELANGNPSGRQNVINS
jgi:hypothetical protein